jgi:hypothetical protein
MKTATNFGIAFIVMILVFTIIYEKTGERRAEEAAGSNTIQTNQMKAMNPTPRHDSSNNGRAFVFTTAVPNSQKTAQQQIAEQPSLFQMFFDSLVNPPQPSQQTQGQSSSQGSQSQSSANQPSIGQMASLMILQQVVGQINQINQLAAAQPQENSSKAAVAASRTMVNSAAAAASQSAPSWDQMFSGMNGQKLDRYVQDNYKNLTPEQRASISKMTGGKSPTQMVAEFCDSARSGEFAEMASSIRADYQGEATGLQNPTVLLDLFEKMSALCP